MPLKTLSFLFLVFAIIPAFAETDHDHTILISIKDQKLVLLENQKPGAPGNISSPAAKATVWGKLGGKLRSLVSRSRAGIAEYPISTSRFGHGDNLKSYATPTGKFEVAKKIGQGAPLGAVFKNRERTGEVINPNAKGRDPIVTRILWLRGLEPSNRNAFARNIYIHGTPQESAIGQQVSYGCIRMRSKDVIDLFNRVGVGAQVEITSDPVRRAIQTLVVSNTGRAS